MVDYLGKLVTIVTLDSLFLRPTLRDDDFRFNKS